jgi:GTP-binding protein Era
MGTPPLPVTKSAVVVLIGRPSVGKSTFINAVVGHKVSIVSPVPQTTRNAIRGIVNRPRGQIVFVDTPGFHLSEKQRNVALADMVKGELRDADAILYLMDATRVSGAEEAHVAALLQGYTDKVVVAINKMDTVAASGAIKATVDPALAEAAGQKNRLFFVSAAENRGLEGVLDALFDLAPEGPAMYGEDFYTDQEPAFRIGEIIREQAMLRVRDEVPHAITVEVADLERHGEGEKLWVRAFLCVEKGSQRGILIGKDASVIKAIRVESIKAIRKVFFCRVELDLQVKVRP